MSLPKGFPPLDQLNTTGGQKRFNGWLQSRAYCAGFVPTALDKTVYETVGIFTDKSLPNLYRWSNHIASFSPDQRAAWGGEATEAPAAPAAKKAKKAKKEESDDDLDDLFGDDDDEEEDDFDTMLAKKIAADKDLQARMKMKADKNAKKGPQKTMFIFDIKPFDTETDLQELAKELKSTEKRSTPAGLAFPIASQACRRTRSTSVAGPLHGNEGCTHTRGSTRNDPPSGGSSHVSCALTGPGTTSKVPSLCVTDMFIQSKS